MRILFITHQFYPHVGGIEVNSEVLAHGFHQAGHTVRLITWTAEKGIKTFPFPVIRQPGFITLLKEHKWAEVVYENNPTLRLSWPAIFFKRISVIALRTWINRKEDNAGWEDKLKTIWLRRASAVIAVSEAVRKQCWASSVVIGNPYRTELFQRLPTIIKHKEFVFLGRLVSDKGADQAIQAIQILKETFGKEYVLTIIGDGEERPALESLVKERKLDGNVIFTGALRGEKLVHQLNEHHYLLVPSNWEEPFGNVALEGMACGCVPIVSDGGGLPDAVGNAGLVFRRGNVGELAACMQKVTENPILDQQLREAAAAHLANQRPDVISKRYLDVITKATVH